MPQAETTAWVAAVVGDGGTVSGTRQTLVDNLIAGLKADGVFSKLDRLWLFWAENSQSALRDLVAAAAATPVNSPGFTVDQGYTGGSTKYISTNFNPTTAPSPKYTRNSASVFTWELTSAAIDGPSIAFLGASFAMRLFPRWLDDKWYSSINDTGSTSEFSVTDASGMRTLSRTISTEFDAYKNGSFFVNSGTLNSSAVVNDTFIFLNENGGSNYTGTLAFGGFGQGLTAQNVADLYTRLGTFKAGVVITYAAFGTPQLDGRTTTRMIGY